MLKHFRGVREGGGEGDSMKILTIPPIAVDKTGNNSTHSFIIYHAKGLKLVLSFVKILNDTPWLKSNTF
jgi:hypothetical protein